MIGLLVLSLDMNLTVLIFYIKNKKVYFMKSRTNQDGQAIVEMTVSLIGLAVVFCGVLLFAELTTRSVENMLSARENADKNGDNDIRVSVDGSHDEGTVIFEDSSSFKDELAVRNATGSFDIYTSTHPYVDSGQTFKNLSDISLLLDAASLTSGSSSSMAIPVEELASKLFLDSPNKTSIILKADTLYMPFTQ